MSIKMFYACDNSLTFSIPGLGISAQYDGDTDITNTFIETSTFIYLY